MAFRTLVGGNRVKIVDNTECRGRFGTVQGDQWGDLVTVEYTMFDRMTGRIETYIGTFKNSELLVACDGAKNYSNDPQDYLDDYYSCPYASWSHSDLVERIKSLEQQIEEMEK